MKTGYYQADTINGVTFYGTELENNNTEISTPRHFADGLKNLGDDETIIAFFSEAEAEILQEIAEEYGIH